MKIRKIGDNFFISKVGEDKYYPHASRLAATLGVVSPSLAGIISKRERKELYEHGKRLSA